jgi:hypothetical protein
MRRRGGQVDEATERLRVLAAAVEIATRGEYRPIDQTTVVIDAALGGEAPERILANVQHDQGAKTVSGELLVVGAALVVHVRLAGMHRAGSAPARDGEIEAVAMPRAALRSVALQVPDHDVDDPAALPGDLDIALRYESIPGPLVFTLGYLGPAERAELLAAFTADLRS